MSWVWSNNATKVDAEVSVGRKQAFNDRMIILEFKPMCITLKNKLDLVILKFKQPNMCMTWTGNK